MASGWSSLVWVASRSNCCVRWWWLSCPQLPCCSCENKQQHWHSLFHTTPLSQVLTMLQIKPTRLFFWLYPWKKNWERRRNSWRWWYQLPWSASLETWEVGDTQRAALQVDTWTTVWVCRCERDAAHLLLAVNVAASAMPGSLLFRLVGESMLPVLRGLEWWATALGWSSLQGKQKQTECLN